MTHAHDEPFFFCNMNALSPEERAAHGELAARLFGSLMLETRELDNGYAFRFAGESFAEITQFMTYERRCCPFFSFDLSVTPRQGPIWLHLTAPGDVKPFMREEFNLNHI